MSIPKHLYLPSEATTAIVQCSGCSVFATSRRGGVTVGTAHWESTVIKEITSKLTATTAGRGWQDSDGDEEERSQQLI